MSVGFQVLNDTSLSSICSVDYKCMRHFLETVSETSFKIHKTDPIACIKKYTQIIIISQKK